MKTLIYGLTLSLGMTATAVAAEQMVNVNGTSYALSTLMDNCRVISDQPEAQMACYSALSQLVDQQAGKSAAAGPSVTDALDALRDVADYLDDASGLSITGSDCNVQIVYFDNYFHISRRNISAIDVFSARFDASKLQSDQIAQMQGGQSLLSKAVMEAGATAAVRGGVGLESAQQGFAPRHPGTPLDVYADEVVTQLPASEDQAFEFVLVHPQRSQASDEIWSAFDSFVTACKG